MELSHLQGRSYVKSTHLSRRAKQSQFLDCRFRTADWRQICGGTPAPWPVASSLGPFPGPIVRNKAKLGRDGVCGERFMGKPIVRNKANLGRGMSEGKCLTEKGLWRIRYADGLGKTKPIAGWTGRDKAGQASSAAGRSNRAKQTQFANLGPGRCAVRTLRARKTKPIWDSPAGARGPVVQNKPNFLRPDTPLFQYSIVPVSAGCAKQSQFSTRWEPMENRCASAGESVKMVTVGAGPCACPGVRATTGGRPYRQEIGNWWE